MRIATVREILNNENRVALTPPNVSDYIRHGHEVMVETNAGLGSGFTDEDYREAGAAVSDSAEEVWEFAELMLKVKEPQPEEFRFLREGLTLFTYLHLAANPALTQALMDSGCTALGYETVRGSDGRLPLLIPMSEIAGRLSVYAGAHYLQKPQGGPGLLLGSMPGVPRAKVVILGAGAAGSAALQYAYGLGADCIVLDINLQKLAELDTFYLGKVTTLYSQEENVREALRDADLVIGTVLIPGARAPKIIRREYLKDMKPGSVIVDVAVDQGGCTEVSRPTTHDDPVFEVDGVTLFCVANMPGAVPSTSTTALTNATIRYGLMIADLGLDAAAEKDPGLAEGINVQEGKIRRRQIAEALELPYED